MTYTVTITSQGQISIPAKLRRKLGLDKSKRALIREENGEIVVKPVKDFMELGGSLHQYVKKNKSIEQIMKEEEEAIAQGFIEREIRFLKQNELKLSANKETLPPIGGKQSLPFASPKVKQSLRAKALKRR